MLVNYTNDFDFETETFKVRPASEVEVSITNLTDHLIGFTYYCEDDGGCPGPFLLKVAEDVNAIKNGIVLVPHETRCLENNFVFDISELNERFEQECFKKNIEYYIEGVDECISVLDEMIRFLKEASEFLNSDPESEKHEAPSITKKDNDLSDFDDNILEMF